MGLVDAAGQVGVAAGAEDGGGAGVGVDAGEVVGTEREATVGVGDGLGTGQEKAAMGLRERALRAADDQSTELKSGVDVGKEGRLVGSEAAVLEVVDAGDAARGGDGLEEAGGGLVGVDAGGGEQADQAVWFDQAQGPFDEERIQIYVAAAQQGVVAGGADDLAQAVGARFGFVEGLGQRIAGFPQAADFSTAGGGGGGAGQLGIAGGEPFDFLELDAVPGRIADDGVEAALGDFVLPVAPDAGEGGFPVEEGFVLGDGFGFLD